MFGLLNVNKPVGCTSHDVVAAVRRRVGRGVKVGHAGTLDPFADGVLVLCLGAATRLADYVQARAKRYRACICVGATSTSDDCEGPITAVSNGAAPDERQVHQVLERFVGRIEQVPPAHSAVHVAGRRAYKLARAGKCPDLPARIVSIHSMELVRYAYPDLEIEVCCGAGTYLRALARDIGSALGVGGYCLRLRRTAVGEFRLDQAKAVDELDLAADLVGPVAAVQSLPKVSLDDDDAALIATGRPVRLHAVCPPAPSSTAEAEGPSHGEVAVLDGDGRLIALASLQDDRRTVRPTKVFTAG